MPSEVFGQWKFKKENVYSEHLQLGFIDIVTGIQLVTSNRSPGPGSSSERGKCMFHLDERVKVKIVCLHST
jgi:hypothetical protein